jgi:hypothetical protein
LATDPSLPAATAHVAILVTPLTPQSIRSSPTSRANGGFFKTI